MGLFDKENSKVKGYTTAIIAAAGSGNRMGKEAGNKQLLYFNDKPVIAHTISAFEEASCIDEIIISTRKEILEEISALVNIHKYKKVSRVIVGGETRQQSVFTAVAQLDRRTKFLAIHDGARPFVDSELINKVCESAYIHKCAAVGVKLKDTIKKIDPDGMISKTVNREVLRAIQTPQVFDSSLYLEGMALALEKNCDYTDDCQLIESVGGRVFFVEGSYNNIKITTNEDIAIAQSIINELIKENSSCTE